MSKFIAEEKFWQLFPDVVIGVIVAKGIDNERGGDELAAMLESACEDARKYIVGEQLSKAPVVAVWREAFTKFKTKKGARCSIEALLKRIDKGTGVGSISPVVDLYNAISLRWGLPAGVEDIDRFKGNLRLTVTAGGDDFLALGDEQPDPTLPGEVCYLDDAGGVCRCWNWREGQRTMATSATKNAIMLIECVDPSRLDDLRAAVAQLEGDVKKYLSAESTSVKFITRQEPEIELK